ncbi:hypothetical protein ACFL6K_05410 [Candidatus Latescibacterota bacterium]
MVELKHDTLVFSFPEVHPKARLRINFQRTLRIPDDGSDYPLPPGLGSFPMKHVDDYSDSVPAKWLDHGGVMLPMYQSEALWISIDTDYIDEHEAEYPFAIKIATGKIDAVTGKEWNNNLRRKPQDYLVAPDQDWLDGYCVEKGIIRQFVAMPLGSGYSVEEQLTGESEHGGLQIEVFPMKRKSFNKHFPKVDRSIRRMIELTAMSFNKNNSCKNKKILSDMELASPDMGLAPGGRMEQDIDEDPYNLNDWDQEHSCRCFVHIANSMIWRSVTGENPPTVPPTAKEYTDHELPWFEYYSENGNALNGGKEFEKVKSITKLAKEKNDNPLPENETVSPTNIVHIPYKKNHDAVREGNF